MNTVQELPDPDAYLRKKIRGQKYTYRELAKRVSELALGNDVTGARPLNWSEIGVEIGIGRELVYTLRDLAIKLKYLELDGGIYKKPKVSELKYRGTKDVEEFSQIPEIQKWIQFMQTSRTGGVLKNLSNHLRDFKHMCDSMEIHPSSWINSDTPLAVFQKGDSLIQDFVKLYSEDKTTIRTTWHKKKADLDKLRYKFVQVRNSFSSAHGYQYPQNFSATSSQSVKRFHGLYADVMLSQEQLNEFENHILSYDEINSDFYRWAMFGVESCSRKMAIKTAKCHYEKIPFRGSTAYVMQVFESKTEHLKKGIYKKYITLPNIQKAIDGALKDDGS